MDPRRDVGCPCGAALGQIPDSRTSTALVLGMLSWNSSPEKPCRFSEIWKFSKTSKCSTFPKIWRCLIKAVLTQDKKQSGYDFVVLGFIFVFLRFISIDVIYISIYGVYIMFRPVVM